LFAFIYFNIQYEKKWINKTSNNFYYCSVCSILDFCFISIFIFWRIIWKVLFWLYGHFLLFCFHSISFFLCIYIFDAIKNKDDIFGSITYCKDGSKKVIVLGRNWNLALFSIASVFSIIGIVGIIFCY